MRSSIGNCWSSPVQTPWDDGDFVYGVGAGNHLRDEGMACFVVSGKPPFLKGMIMLRLSTHHEHLFLRMLEVVLSRWTFSRAGGYQGSLVDEVGEVCAGEPGVRGR